MVLEVAREQGVTVRRVQVGVEATEQHRARRAELARPDWSVRELRMQSSGRAFLPVTGAATTVTDALPRLLHLFHLSLGEAGA